MSAKILGLLTAATVLLAAPVSEAADIRLKVKTKVLGNKRTGDTRKTQRQLKIEIDNRDREAYDGVTMEWMVIARDIQTRKLSIAGSGTKEIDLPANDEIDVMSDPYSFSFKNR